MTIEKLADSLVHALKADGIHAEVGVAIDTFAHILLHQGSLRLHLREQGTKVTITADLCSSDLPAIMLIAAIADLWLSEQTVGQLA